jgi:hypothetical protein
MTVSSKALPWRHKLGGVGAATLLSLFAGCFTEVGNPGPPQKFTTDFRIDYQETMVAPLQKRGVAESGLLITQLFFNVIEVNYRTLDDQEGRIWKVPDSLGKLVDFTGKDTAAILPPVDVPPGEWGEFKLESRVPSHSTVAADTLDGQRFANRGYIGGVLPPILGGQTFYCQFPNFPKINLVYNDSVLSQYRVGDTYHIDVVFYANRWLSTARLDTLSNPLQVETDKNGQPIVLIDREHNVAAYNALAAAFFKSFNSWKVWKEGDPAP